MKKTAMYFTHVAAAVRPGAALLCGHMVDQGSDPSFTRFSQARDDNNWAHVGDLRDDVVYALASAASENLPGKTDFYALGREGVLRLMLAGQPDQDVAIPMRDKTSYLEGLCLASDGLYACGGQKQVLCYSNSFWQPADAGLYEKFDGSNDSALFAMAELSAGVLLAVGTRGLVVRRSGDGAWQTLDAPTNLDLHAVIASGDGGAWIAGDGGTLFLLLAGTDTWEDHANTALSTSTFDGLALHQDALYVTALNRLLRRMPGGKLEQVKGPFKKGSEFHSVSAVGDFLWAVGDEHVYRLGPEGWKYFLCPDNV
jgi:hypothetical protein